MIYQHTYQQVLDLFKTQTRRLVKPGEWCKREIINHLTLSSWDGDIHSVLTKKGHLKWKVGRTYAVQPGRGKKSVGRILITGIRRERLRDISMYDIECEGVVIGRHDETYKRFGELWNSIHTKSGTRWQDNPDVWVLEFELVT